MKRKAVWRKLHRQLALATGALVAVMGLSGSLMVFEHELDALLEPQLYAAGNSPSTGGYAVGIAAAMADLPAGAALTSVEVSVHSPQILIVCADEHSADICAHVTRSGEVLGKRVSDTGFVAWLYRLHQTFLLPVSNVYPAGLIGLCLLLLLISGLSQWMPRRGALMKNLRVRFSQGKAAFYYQLHRTLGVVTAIGLLLSCLTGLYFVFPEPYHLVLGDPETALIQREFAANQTGRDTVSAADAIAIALKRVPHTRFRWLNWKEQSNAYRILLSPVRQNVAHIDEWQVMVDKRGSIIGINGPDTLGTGGQVLAWFLPVHSGSALGLAGRIFTALTGLAAFLLFVTGLTQWILKRKARSTR